MRMEGIGWLKGANGLTCGTPSSLQAESTDAVSPFRAVDVGRLTQEEMIRLVAFGRHGCCDGKNLNQGQKAVIAIRAFKLMHPESVITGRESRKSLAAQAGTSPAYIFAGTKKTPEELERVFTGKEPMSPKTRGPGIPAVPNESKAQNAQAKVQTFTLDHAMAGVFFSPTLMRCIVSALRRKKNVVLQGPPGVGKSFVARQISYAIIRRKAPANVEMVQFHQSYSYEDFIAGYRPRPTGGFQLRTGVFHDFCYRAAWIPNKTTSLSSTKSTAGI